MPFKRIDYRDLNMYYVLNPDPATFARASHENLPPSNPFKPGLPVLVFIHAAAANVTSWRAQLGDPRLANSFNLFAMDCRFSGWTTGGERTQHTLENRAECVMATLDEMNFQSYSVYGEGVHGSNVAAWLATKRAHKVDALLLASPGFMSEPPHVVAQLQEVQQALRVNKEGRGDNSGTFPPEALEHICAYFMGGSERLAPQREEMKVRFQQRYGAGAGSSFHDVRWLFEAVYNRKPVPQDLLALIKCPVLILRGADDKVVCPVEACEAWQRSFVNAKGPVGIHAISSAPGLISLSDSNIVNRIIMQFLQRSLAGK
ncbi:alpha/beta fold hydrolase [Rhodotorula paludigena]|uniref:alpha/beta fold hydrolase n=1 Tax=Rhodotorula paludigena TaxID=86838 RepID=UPI003180F09F